MARGFGTTDGVGTTDVVTTGYQTGPTTVTYSIWAYITGAGGGNLGRVFDKDSAGVGKRDFYYNTSATAELWFEVGFSTTDGAWSITAPATGAWHHFIITYDGGNVANVPVIYLDGTSQSVTTNVAPVGTIDTSATNYLIGNRADGIRNFNGRLAEFAQWARILTAGEIAALAGGMRADGIATPDFYFRLLGNDSPEPNYIITGTDGTLTGTAKQAHPTQVPVGIVAAGVVESLRTDTSDPMTWTHNVGTTAPKGVAVGFMHGTSSTDHVLTVTYGSKSLTRRQRNTDTATEPGAAEWWFATGSIPTGNQTVTADLASGTTDDILGVSITLEADYDLEVVDVDGINENAANPSVTMNVVKRYSMAFGALYSGLTNGTSITAGTGTKKITTNDLSGNFTAVAIRQKVTLGADFAIGCTSATDDVAYAAMSIAELVPAMVPSVSDATTVTDSSTVSFPVASLSISVFDASTVTESVTVQLLPILLNVNDATTATESTTLTFVWALQTFSDATTVTESNPLNLLLQPTVFDATTVTEGQILDLLLQPIVFDASTVTEAQSFSLALPPISDSTTVTEATTLTFVWSFGTSDTTTVDELATVQIEGAAVVPHPNVFDATTVDELVGVLLLVLTANIGDNTTVTEAATTSILLFPVASDTTTPDEATDQQLLPLFLLVTDTTTVSEGLQMAMPQPPDLITVGDDTTVTDDRLLALLLNFSVVEVILLTEATTMIQTHPPLEIVAIESLTAVGGKLTGITSID